MRRPGFPTSIPSSRTSPPLDPSAAATALIATLQGGYVLARAAGAAQVYTQAIDGTLGLLTHHSAQEENA